MSKPLRFENKFENESGSLEVAIECSGFDGAVKAIREAIMSLMLLRLELMKEMREIKREQDFATYLRTGKFPE